MRIAFDGTTLRHPQTGIGYYTEHLLRHLVCEAPKNEWIVLSNHRITTSLPLPAGVRALESYPFPIRNLWMQFLAPLILRSTTAEIAHFTNSIAPVFKQTPTVVTLHDMTLYVLPAFHPRRRLLTRPLMRLSAERADAVITVSQFSRQDILRRIRIPKERVHVIPEAAAPAFRPLNDHQTLEQVRRRYQLPDRFILFVGTLEPRKNLGRLIEAYALLRKSGAISHQLICVGPFGWGYRTIRSRIESLDLGDAVRLVGYVPFQDLPAFYNLCELFAFPSLHEGFGLPVIEAMACGAPVITASNSSLGEIAGNCAQLVDPRQTDSIAEALYRLTHDQELRTELGRRGLGRAQQFSWDRAARETLAVYRAVCGDFAMR